MSQSTTHTNDERTVRCPVDDCDATPLARGVHLHVMRSSGDGHGENGDVPDHITFDDLETVGSRSVSMDYPNERDNETVERLCPHCQMPFRGGHGVMIHLGEMAGRKNHPENPTSLYEPDDFAVVKLDENDNIVEYIEDGPTMPSASQTGDLSEAHIDSYINALRSKGMDDEADLAESLLIAGE